jgi:hypothetical protein
LRSREEIDAELMKRGHRIHDLVSLLEERLALVSDEPLRDEDRATLAELAQFDETGERFRYARRAKGGRLVRSFEEPSEFDVARLRTRLGEAIRFLQDGVGGWLEAEIEFENEKAAETPSWDTP